MQSISRHSVCIVAGHRQDASLDCRAVDFILYRLYACWRLRRQLSDWRAEESVRTADPCLDRKNFPAKKVLVLLRGTRNVKGISLADSRYSAIRRTVAHRIQPGAKCSRATRRNILGQIAYSSVGGELCIATVAAPQLALVRSSAPAAARPCHLGLFPSDRPLFAWSDAFKGTSNFWQDCGSPTASFACWESAG